MQENAEADSFACFVRLLSDSVDHFCQQLDNNSSVGIHSTLSRFKEMLKANDEELWQHLELTTEVSYIDKLQQGIEKYCKKIFMKILKLYSRRKVLDLMDVYSGKNNFWCIICQYVLSNQHEVIDWFWASEWAGWSTILCIQMDHIAIDSRISIEYHFENMGLAFK